MAQIPVMLSCVEHCCELVPANRLRILAFLGRDDAPDAVSEAVSAMDRRTHEGVTTGTVSLSGRPVHVGGLVPATTHPARRGEHAGSQLRHQVDKQALWQVWQHTGRSARAGQVRWVP